MKTPAENIAALAHSAAAAACAAYGIEIPINRRLAMFVPQYKHSYMLEYNRLLSDLISAA